VTLAASCDAREQGCRFGVVGASEMGENVNLRRGFEQYCLLQTHNFMHNFMPDPERRPL
jgi:hypothetical protein